MEARYVKVASRFFLVGKGDAGCGGRHHFLDACFLCKRSITSDRHIFMYKGDAAFCSDDCRQDQMDMDAALKAAARRHRLLRSASSPASAACAVNKAAEAASAPAMARRPTIAGLAAHASVVSG
ncbi:FCS-Like Zinc finger 2-like [Phragmites australis]|uniref:FCS-Like Zinc finger 2-like n=1 Tax=Phragmites australis TaxID=29695 RepID=UPI002D7A0FF4|nr:FCS-Like Zinc finger 2-like [Phragmites australis]